MRKLENGSNKTSLRKYADTTAMPHKATWKKSKHKDPEVRKGHPKKLQKEPEADGEWRKGLDSLQEPRKSEMSFKLRGLCADVQFQESALFML